MRCRFCNSEWNSTSETSLCTFCGKTLSEPDGFNDAKSVLSFIIAEHGTKVFDTPGLLVSYFADYAPKLYKERKLIKLCTDARVVSTLYSAFNLTTDEKKLVAEQSVHKLHDEYFVDEIAAINSVNWFIEALDWGVHLQQPESSDSPDLQGSVAINEQEDNQIRSENACENLHPDFLNHLLCGDKDYVFGISTENEICSCGSGGEDYLPTIIEDVGKWKNIISLHKSPWVLGYGEMIFGLKSNGTVAVTRSKYKNDPRSLVANWNNIKYLSAGFSHVVGVKTDGTVVACGENRFGQCNVSAWKNVVSAQAYQTSTVGVLNNGDVIYTGDAHSLKTFHDIRRMDDYYKIGIRNDGTLAVADSFFAWKENNPTDWLLSLSNVKNLYCNYDAILAILYDGTVQCMFRRYGLLDTVSSWNNIIQVITDGYAVVGLCSDGTILAADEKGPVLLTQDIDDVIHVQFRIDFDLLVLQSNGRLRDISLYRDSEDSWTRSVRGWILFSPAVCDISDFKKYRYNDGGFYIGNWRDGKRHGNGIYVYCSGEKMSGEFRNDQIYNGEGVVCYKDGRFIGSFVGGQKTGKGARIWNSGARYDGEYRNNKMNGKGIYTWQDGSSWEGEFKDDEPWDGEGTWHYQDGKTKTGRWKNGRKKLF